MHDSVSREKELKGWTRKKKLDLIKSDNPNLLDLSEQLFEDYGISKDEIQEYIREFRQEYGATH